MKKRLLAACSAAIITICIFVLFFPREVLAETPGRDLVIRVGYMGDPNDYKVKATLSESQIKSLPQQTNRYTNLSTDGTIKSFIAEGPKISAILNAADIAPGDVDSLTLKTANGTRTGYEKGDYLEGGRYYYPNLENNWKKKGSNGTPLRGALDGMQSVDTILAVRSSDENAQKPTNGAEGLTPGMMNAGDSYRFCAGQTPLTEGVEASAAKNATSGKNAKSIYGIDLTLYGGPVRDLVLELDQNRIIAGCSVQARANITVDPLFIKNVEDVELIWTSSNHEVATVDDKGLIVFKKKGRVSIKVAVKNGMAMALGLNVFRELEKTDQDQEDPDDPDDPDAATAVPGKTDGNHKGAGKTKSVQTKDKTKTKKTVKSKKLSKKKNKKIKKGTRVKEISLGNQIEVAKHNWEELNNEEMSFTKREANIAVFFVSGFTISIFFIGGALIKIDSYFKDR